MKKRIAVALCLFLVMLTLIACGEDSAAVDYNGYSYEELVQELEMDYSLAQGIAELLAQGAITEADREGFLSYYGLTDAQFDAGFRWLEVEETAGTFQKADEESISIVKSGNTLTTDIILKFEKRDVDFQVVYTYYNMEVSGITIEPVYSLSEKLSKAGLNTLISVMIVFCVLVLISLLIACFNIFPYLEKKKAAQKAAQTPLAVPADPVITPSQTQEDQKENQISDDLELIAVIAAAIAADTGKPASDFVVRSIHRR